MGRKSQPSIICLRSYALREMNLSRRNSMKRAFEFAHVRKNGTNSPGRFLVLNLAPALSLQTQAEQSTQALCPSDGDILSQEVNLPQGAFSCKDSTVDSTTNVSKEAECCSSVPLPELTKFGIIVTKKVGNAVMRVALRRRIREIIREHADSIMWAGNVVVILRYRAPSASYQELEQDFRYCLKRLLKKGLKSPSMKLVLDANAQG